MLTSLYIKDYALIKEVTIEFGPGLNIITGETGAGKSIMLDALGLVLGGRAYVESVRTGSQKAFVEGVFRPGKNSADRIEQILTENEIEPSTEIIIRREVSLKGSSRAFVNDTPVSINTLKEIGDCLVDLHGQHEHQAILHPDNHIGYLDSFAKTSSLRDTFSAEALKLQKLLSEQREIETKKEELKEKREFYAFRLREIDSVSPQPGEDVDLEKELNILENAEKILTLTSSAFAKLYEGEPSSYDLVFSARKEVESLGRIDASFAELVPDLEQALAAIQGSAEMIRDYMKNIDLDPSRLEACRERLVAINRLKKKFGGSLEEVIETREKLLQEIDLADNFSDHLAGVNRLIAEQREVCGNIAKELSEKRALATGALSEGIVAKLSELGIKSGNFVVNIAHEEPGPKDGSFIVNDGKAVKFDENGIDKVEFYISTNAGEHPKPLVKVASGGEVSRVMLSLKSVLAGMDRIPVLVFDEIDTGISGRIAQKVGIALKSLSQFHQIIAITHLPQIAAYSDIHFSVQKFEQNGSTSTQINKLSPEDKINEIAKLISGSEVTSASIKSAKELIEGEGLFG
ncbi:MAG: DNA repair protein RecN [Bacteroidetes bacterium]|nr:DNA repair protein RecN [Bacteroidota bacterium]